MLTHEYQTMRTVEDTYWWYNTLWRMVEHEMSRRLPGPAARLLDAGCGTGGMMARLHGMNAAWQITGVDMSPHAVAHSRARECGDVVAGTVTDLPFAGASFDALLSLDVLYHRNVDQGRALEEFARVLTPGGFLVLNLPAFSSLAGSHDAAVGGVRRYTRKDVRTLLKQAGFRVETLHYWNAWLFLPVLGWRWLSRLLPSRGAGRTRSDLAPLGRRLNGTLGAVSQFDARVCRAMDLPLGTSMFAVATLEA